MGMKNWLKIMRMILEAKCFRFKVEEKDEKAVPRRVWEYFGIKNYEDLKLEREKFALPTKCLIGYFSPIYPNKKIKCLYIGESGFWITSEPSDFEGEFLVNEVAKLYKDLAKEYFQKRNFHLIERKIREYEENFLTKEPIKKEIVVERPKPPKPVLAKKERKVPKKIQKIEKVEKIEIPPLDEIRKEVDRFVPKDAFSQMAKIRFEAVLSILRDEKLKEELYKAFYLNVLAKNNQKDFFREASLIQKQQEILQRKKPEPPS
jgi:hypothetical protein